MKKRITWKVDPEDMAGHMDVHGSSSNPALVVLYMLICVVLVVVLGNVIHRWKIPFSDANRRKEKAVSFKRAIASLRQAGRFSRNRRNSVDQPLCDTDNEDGDYFETDGTRFEEMGVDIRNVSDL